MSPEELAAIRERADNTVGRPARSTAFHDRIILLAEVERLQREEQSLHGRLRDSERTIHELFARNRTAQARLDKVRAATLEEAPVYYTQDQASGYDSAMGTIADSIDGSDQ